MPAAPAAAPARAAEPSELSCTELSCTELLSTTRAVRAGLDLNRPVDPALVWDCLRIAVQAPTGANRQHWRWIVLTDPAPRPAVAEIYRAAFHERNADALARLDEPGNSAAAEDAAARTLRGARDLAERLHLVPVLVLPCLELTQERLPAGNQAGTWGSLLPAAWNYALAARTRGLATTWTTAHLARERDVADVLGLPRTVHQGALLPTAHSRRERYSPAARRPLEEVVHMNGWQSGGRA